MAVLGAKRPQNIGWQFIVLTLWIVLILPVGERMVLWQAGALDEGPARRWLIVILLILGMTNYALTRFSFAALLGTTGQVMLLIPHLPLVRGESEAQISWGIVCIAAGIIWAWRIAGPRTHQGWDAVWRDFRDAFGMVWSLRVMERVNSTGKLSGWKSSLTWYGFAPPIGSQEESNQVSRTLRTLLRRFVSAAWIEDRLPDKQPYDDVESSRDPHRQ